MAVLCGHRSCVSLCGKPAASCCSRSSGESVLKSPIARKPLLREGWACGRHWAWRRALRMGGGVGSANRKWRWAILGELGTRHTRRSCQCMRVPALKRLEPKQRMRLRQPRARVGWRQVSHRQPDATDLRRKETAAVPRLQASAVLPDGRPRTCTTKTP